jgi:hypothetical protein
MKARMQTYLFDIAKRLIKWDKKLEIYKNGVDNGYTERTDRLVNNSVTAKMSAGLMQQYLIGKGFGENDDLIVNQDSQQELIEFAEELDESLVVNRGVTIHFNYKVESTSTGSIKYVPTNPKIVPFETSRVGKKDSKKYNGKILLCDDWLQPKITEKEVSVYDVFNPIQEVVEAQIKKAGGIKKYKGQILYINYDKKYYYPLSRIDTVMNDCDSEAQASVYKNQLLRNGFFGKTLVITKPLVDSDYDESYSNPTEEIISSQDYRHYQRQRSEADQTKETIQSFIGADQAGGAMLIELESDGDKFEDAILIKQIESKIDDKMFEFTENSVSKNILMAFCNIPVALVKSPDSSLFGNSGEALREAKKTYWENTEKERNRFVKILNKVLKHVGVEKEVNVIPLIDVNNNKTNNESADTAVQATI